MHGQLVTVDSVGPLGTWVRRAGGRQCTGSERAHGPLYNGLLRSEQGPGRRQMLFEPGVGGGHVDVDPALESWRGEGPRMTQL